MTGKIRLRQFQSEDLSIFKEWLKKDHVKKWYTGYVFDECNGVFLITMKD